MSDTKKMIPMSMPMKKNLWRFNMPFVTARSGYMAIDPRSRTKPQTMTKPVFITKWSSICNQSTSPRRTAIYRNHVS